MRLTNWLLAGILVVLLAQFFPALTHAIFVIAAVIVLIYAIWFAVFRLPAQLKAKRVAHAQLDADDKLFWECHAKRKAIDLRYDPEMKWGEATQVPESYKKEIRALNRAYKDMWKRRNGYDDLDDED